MCPHGQPFQHGYRLCSEIGSRYAFSALLRSTDHNVRDTLEVIDRAYIIHDGMVLMEGAPNDIVGNEDVRRVYLGDRFSL